jgi:streptomycin 6-kinase
MVNFNVHFTSAPVTIEIDATISTNEFHGDYQRLHSWSIAFICQSAVRLELNRILRTFV